MEGAAERLLLTPYPQNAARDFTQAFMKLQDGEEEDVPEEVMMVRPATDQRGNGRMAMTVLREVHMDEDDAACNTREAIPLTVALNPDTQHAGTKATSINFEEKFRSVPQRGMSRPKLCVFEHVEGSKVSDGLFPDYLLPNGMQAYFYYQPGSLLTERDAELRDPPPMPPIQDVTLCLNTALNAAMEKVLVPPGTLMELYTMNKIVPPLAPLPTCHTLEVEDPGDLGTSAFGALADVPLEFQLEYKRVSKVHAKIRRTRIMPSME
ncbi:hypothetical protein CYMTET_24067, partial [Cymbomonas tetramitiformis]